MGISVIKNPFCRYCETSWSKVIEDKVEYGKMSRAINLYEDRKAAKRIVQAIL